MGASDPLRSARHAPGSTQSARSGVPTCSGTLREVSRATPDLDGCRQLLELIAEEVQAEQAVLILSNPLTGELRVRRARSGPEVPRRYADYYCGLDPTGLPAYVTGSRLTPAGTPPYSVSDLMEVVDYGSFVSTEFYNDFLKSAKIHYDLVAFLSPNTGTRGAICLHRARQRKPFSDEEIAVLDLIAPFVGQSPGTSAVGQPAVDRAVDGGQGRDRLRSAGPGAVL